MSKSTLGPWIVSECGPIVAPNAGKSGFTVAVAYASDHEISPDLLAALKKASTMIGAYALCLERGGNQTDANAALSVESLCRAAVAKAESRA